MLEEWAGIWLAAMLTDLSLRLIELCKRCARIANGVLDGRDQRFDVCCDIDFDE